MENLQMRGTLDGKTKVFDTIIFDLDGTLLNTLEDLADSVNYALEGMGFPRRSSDEIRKFLGNGGKRLIQMATPEDTSQEQREECLTQFRDYYDRHMDHKTKPYPGVIFLLQGLREWGVKTAVVSNKYDSAVKGLCGKYFNGLVDAAVGDCECRRRKPAPDNVLEALRLLDSRPERTLYVGDSEVDMETAKNAGLTSVGVTWGFRSEALLIQTGAKYLATRPSHIWSLLVSRNQGIEFEASWKENYEGAVLSGKEHSMRDCPYLAQSDRRWGRLPFGKTGTIEDDGCGPASLAMAVNTLTGRMVALPEIVEWAAENDCFCEGKGCYHRLIPQGGAHFGLRVEAIGADRDKLLGALRAGKLAIAVLKRGHFSGGGHFILLRGITKEGKILVADPGSYPRSKAEWDVNLLLSDLSVTAGSGGPLWVLGEQQSQ